MELISVIMPLYNSERFIEQSVYSVLHQTYDNWEMLIVDDQSNDNSFLMVQAFAKKDNRIRIFRNDKNSGSAKSRNVGLLNCHGHYVAFLDADDFWEPDFLEKQMDFLSRTKSYIVTSGYIRKAPKSSTEFIPPAIIEAKSILSGNPLSCLSTLFSREKANDILFDENLLKAEDLLFWYRILQAEGPARGNPLVLATYTIHNSSKSRKKVKLIKWQWKIYRQKIGLTFFQSALHLCKWALYGIKKYRHVH